MQGTGWKGWWGVVWALRLSVPVLGYAAYLAFDDFAYGWSAAALAAMATAGLGQWAARRQALGWIIDEAGERQKVRHWNRGQALFEPTTRTARITQEAVRRDQRRKRLYWSALIGVPAALLAWSLWQFQIDLIAFVAIPVIAIAAIALSLFVFDLGTEVLYQIGFQDMKGAKVLDAQPLRPGLEQVLRQKAHGGARLASESEALSLLNPKR